MTPVNLYGRDVVSALPHRRAVLGNDMCRSATATFITVRLSPMTRALSAADHRTCAKRRVSTSEGEVTVTATIHDSQQLYDATTGCVPYNYGAKAAIGRS